MLEMWKLAIYGGTYAGLFVINVRYLSFIISELVFVTSLRDCAFVWVLRQTRIQLTEFLLSFSLTGTSSIGNFVVTIF